MGPRNGLPQGKNGYVVDKIDDIEVILKDLQQSPWKLNTLADEAIKLAESFDWRVLIKDWEKVIENLVR